MAEPVQLLPRNRITKARVRCSIALRNDDSLVFMCAKPIRLFLCFNVALCAGVTKKL